MFGGDGECSAVFHGIYCVEEEVDEGLCQEVGIAADDIALFGVGLVEVYLFLFELLLDDLEGACEDFVHARGVEARLGGAGEAEELVDDGVNAFDLLSDQEREGLAEVFIVVAVGEELRECLEGDERVFDFVGHARGECADAGESVGSADLFFELLEERQIFEQQEGAQLSAGVAAEGDGAEANGETFGAVHGERDFDISPVGAAGQGGVQRECQIRRQALDGLLHERFINVKDALCLAIAHRDSPFVIGGNDACDHAVEKYVVVDRAVLDLGVEVGIFEADGELIAEHLERALLGLSVDAAGEAGAEEDNAFEDIVGIDADRDNAFQRGDDVTRLDFLA